MCYFHTDISKPARGTKGRQITPSDGENIIKEMCWNLHFSAHIKASVVLFSSPLAKWKQCWTWLFTFMCCKYSQRNSAAWRYPGEMNLFLSCFVFLRRNSVLCLELFLSEEISPKGPPAVWGSVSAHERQSEWDMTDSDAWAKKSRNLANSSSKKGCQRTILGQAGEFCTSWALITLTNRAKGNSWVNLIK